MVESQSACSNRTKSDLSTARTQTALLPHRSLKPDFQPQVHLHRYDMAEISSFSNKSQHLHSSGNHPAQNDINTHKTENVAQIINIRFVSYIDDHVFLMIIYVRVQFGHLYTYPYMVLKNWTIHRESVCSS